MDEEREHTATDEEEPEDEKLQLGDRRLEKFIEDLATKGSKIGAFTDEATNMAKNLHGVSKAVNVLEISIGDMDSELMSVGYEQQSVEEQLAELPPEQQRVRKSTAQSVKGLQNLQKEGNSDRDSKAFFLDEIAVLERSIGLGSGWTSNQLHKKRQLERAVEELVADKERRQQELNQVRRENGAGRDSTARASDALDATASELEATQTNVAKFEGQVAEHAEKKRLKQDEMRDLYAEHERLQELDPKLFKQVEDGLKEISDLQRRQHEQTRKIDTAGAVLDATVHSKDQKQREIDDAKVFTKVRASELSALEASIASSSSEALELEKQSERTGKLKEASYVDDLTFAVSDPSQHSYFMGLMRARFEIDEG
mmetsp:Transcript_73067/g.147061  ORF Transcript_73067/g.147061 Transcript_73067/m.147061 type:complete len:370 (+) Transcript_73067:532-1641(+)